MQLNIVPDVRSGEEGWSLRWEGEHFSIYKVSKPRTIEDLLAENLKPSRTLVRLVPDSGPDYQLPYDWGTKLKDSYITYCQLAAGRNRIPEPKRWLDKLRWSLHRTLIRWKVLK